MVELPSLKIAIEVFDGLSLNILLDGKRVGFIDAFESKDEDNKVWIEYMYILQKHRNNGFGTKAMKLAISLWRSLGYRKVSLDDIHWEKPQDFWGRLGFQGEGKRKTLNIKDIQYTVIP